MKLESQKELSMKGTKKILFYLLYTWQKKQVLRLSTLVRIVFYSDIWMVDEQTRWIRMTCKQENIGSTINVARYDATATLSVGSMKIYWIICMLWDEKAYRVTKRMCGYFRVKDMSYIFSLFLSYKNLICVNFFLCMFQIYELFYSHEKKHYRWDCHIFNLKPFPSTSIFLAVPWDKSDTNISKTRMHRARLIWYLL